MTTWRQLRPGDWIICPTSGLPERVTQVGPRGGRQWVRTTRHDHTRPRTEKVATPNFQTQAEALAWIDSPDAADWRTPFPKESLTVRRHLVVQCMECGHLHWTHEGYIPCPIQGCLCPYAGGDDYATQLHTFDRIARLLETQPREGD